MKKNPVKRGRGGNKSKESKKSLTILGNNVAGIRGKEDSLNQLMNEIQPGVIMLQETKMYKQGKLKIPGFVIFENLRNYGGGGGLLTAIHENLNPVMIENDEENDDILVVDTKHGNDLTIRCINCYGPQEHIRKKKDIGNDDNENATHDNSSFFLKLQVEIQCAKSSGSLICIQMDANSKFGNEIIKGDPNIKMSENGKVLHEIIQSEDLVLVNASDKCFGTITRHRKTKKSLETSVIDFFILCRRLFEMLSKMTIDEERNMVLTKYSTRKGVPKITESDHNPMWCDFDIQWSSFVKKDKKEVFNFKDTDSQEMFKLFNDKNEKLISSLSESNDIISGGRKWFSELKDSIHK